MAGRAVEAKQRTPPRRLERDAFLSVQRTADALMQGLIALLKPAGLSPAQYNVLRILRGAEPDGLACGEIAARMITRDPDITRLLDRLEARKLIARSRQQKDRRVVTTRITVEGLRVLRNLNRPVEEFHRKQLGHMGRKKLQSLIAMLDSAREAAE